MHAGLDTPQFPHTTTSGPLRQAFIPELEGLWELAGLISFKSVEGMGKWTTTDWAS